MTDTKELDDLVSQARYWGATVTITYDEKAKLAEGKRIYESIQVTGLGGVGPYPMTPISAAEALRPAVREALHRVVFTKRTNDPKLAWIERELDKMGISHRRNGESFHAPILEVYANELDKAYTVLNRRIGRFTVDDIRDDHPRWNA